ncbi:DUF5330 domain-containing protein [Nitratireductor sp. ZSWI3]|uniref:DUF5330 domain-containing protein n=1 Tax=Nitratireductor sp. ZSWI3 TaxID=2966359 RepID=UPI00214F6809|nr:DUF5330 domain-containing protein [Nitratireductor sp. ZSWI3]MCR4265332.1 DUF5330 domain-containing protein [Nitratireductor sp. ZSWI3]
MWFLIRSIFWLSLVLLLVPIGGGNDEKASPIGPLQALSAAREAVTDMVGICERKPEVCATGKAALQTIGVRARESARLAYEMIEDNEPAEGAPLTTGSIAAPDAPVPAER